MVILLPEFCPRLQEQKFDTRWGSPYRKFIQDVRGLPQDDTFWIALIYWRAPGGVPSSRISFPTQEVGGTPSLRDKLCNSGAKASWRLHKTVVILNIKVHMH